MSSISSPRLILGAAVLVAVLCMVAVRYLPTAGSGLRATSDVPMAASSSVPAFGSAHFDDPDPIRALGPEWTLLRQDEHAKSHVPFEGAVARRETVVKLVGKETQLLIDELTIIDGKAIEASITKQKLTKTQVAGRDGYVVPLADIAGGTGFAIVGNTTVLLLQYGTSATWPTDLEPEILSYIANVNVQ